MYALDDVQSALDCVPADDYAHWMTMLCALKCAAHRGVAGLDDASALEIFVQWSQKSDDHEHRQVDYHWSRARKSGSTLSELFDLAMKHGWTKPEPPCCIAKIRVQISDPRLFLITIAGHEDRGEVVMRAEDMNSKQKFRTRVFNKIDMLVDLPTAEQINRLCEGAEIVEVDDGATLLGQFHIAITRFLDEFMQADRRALVGRAMAAWRDEKTGRTWFRSDDLLTWLKRERNYIFGDQSSLYMLVCALGGGHDVLYIAKKKATGESVNRRLWWAPIDPRVNLIELDPLVVPPETEDEAATEKVWRDAERRRYFAQKRDNTDSKRVTTKT